MDLLNLTPAQKVEIQSLIDSAPYVLKVGEFDERSSFVTLALAKHFRKPYLFNSEKSEFFTYIINIAVNCAIDAHRSKGSKMSKLCTVRLSETGKDGEDVSHKFEKYLTDNSADFSAESDKKVIFDTFMAKVNTLPELTKKMLLMKLQGYKLQTIADELDVPLGTVKGTINRSFHKIGYSHLLDNVKDLSQGYKDEKKESVYLDQKEIDRLKYELA